MRKGPLSSNDKRFIEDNMNLSTSELAKKLDRSEASVSKFYDSIEATEEATKEAPKPETQTMQTFGRNKKYGVVVMTENASMLSDENRNKAKVKEVEQIRKIRGAIHRIRGE